MNLEQALTMLGPVPAGVTSLIAAPESINCAPASLDTALPDAQRQLEAAQKAQGVAGSDAAYWGYQGQVSYWKAVVALLQAVQLVGPDDLPDIPAPHIGGVLMDICGQQENFGESMLKFARVQSVHKRVDVQTVVVGNAHPGTTPPEGSRRQVVAMTMDDLERIGGPIMTLLNELQQSERSALVLQVLLFVAGQVMAQEGVMIDFTQPAESVIGSLKVGYEMASPKPEEETEPQQG